MKCSSIKSSKTGKRHVWAVFPLLSLLLFAACGENETFEEPDTVPPSAVTALNAIVGDGQVTLNWTDPTEDDFDHVEITCSRSEEKIFVEKGIQTALITGLINGEEYTFSLTTVDAAGNAGRSVVTPPCIPVSVDPDDVTPPAEVSELSGEAGNGKVTLRWTDPTDADFAKVSITYSPGGTTAIEIGKGRQEAVIAGLKNGSEYVFTLKTADVAGNMSTGIVSDGFTPEATAVTPPSGTSVNYTINGVPFTMIYVEGGTFTMGSDAEAALPGTQRANQAHEHQVTLSSYWIGETEVTIALWNAVMGSGGGSNTTPVASITRN